jgi:hypothetical protein
MHPIFWFENLKGSDHLEHLGVDVNMRMDLREIKCEGLD